ncbi:hypothetical protein [Bowmanella yangjiangensis]|uniref:Uncharacterized protein n=1 Tax=Bowmanella yangjiangensis TaxID=2811230 RepID=A0ABS3CV99_9ALTE|nr:hypothetical protein [Bowmanella yangjiangensis]MBN7820530.1 hypothetical protein [Bowmanella yangjiangensis]
MSFNPDIHEKIYGPSVNPETGEVTQVEKGYRIKPQEAAPEPIRVISVGSFRRRFTLDEDVLIETSTDPKVRVLEKRLMASTYVDLDFPETVQGIGYLEQVGIIAAGRSAEILADGTDQERPGR